MKKDAQVDDEKAKAILRWIIIIFALLFFVIGSVVFVGATKEALSAHESASWPSVPGTILVSEIDRYESRGTMGGGSNIRTSILYRPFIKYTYLVDGVSYKNNRVKISALSDSQGRQAKFYVNKYPVDESVMVSYSPKNPASSVLEPGLNKTNTSAIFVGLLFMVMGIVIFLARRIYIDREY